MSFWTDYYLAGKCTSLNTLQDDTSCKIYNLSRAKAKEEKKAKLQKELQEKADEIERAKFAAETMYKGMGGVAGEGGNRRRQFGVKF